MKLITASDIISGMSKRYCAPEWALFFNVANGTGAHSRRYADAIGMSLFPSRGLEIHGFEIKVSKGDWKREAADPEKAEMIAAYCDRWWVVTPPDLLTNENIPPNWGWLAYDGRAFYTKQKAEKTEAKALDRPFLAALLRRAHESNDALLHAQVKEKTDSIETEIRRRVDQELKSRTYSHQELEKAVTEFEKNAGIKITSWRAESVGKAVAIIEACGVTKAYNGAPHIAQQLRHAADVIDKAFADSGLILETAEP